MSFALKSHLFNRYGSFADKRIKNIDKGKTFIADSRSAGGIASDGSLYGWFCGILVEVPSDEEVRLALFGSKPRSRPVDETILALGGSPESERVELHIKNETLHLLRKLADNIAAIVAPGRRYSVPGYKYMCPRTASSLRDLAGYLDEFWNR